MRRYIEVSPARRDLSFVPTHAKYRLILSNLPGIFEAAVSLPRHMPK